MEESILSKLQTGMSLVDKLLPMAGMLGPQAAAIGKIVDGLLEVSEVVIERAGEAGVVLSSSDQNEIRAINQRLAALNDDVARRIAAS